MLSKTQTRPPRGGALRARQAGVVLMMALIVLVAMTLAGIALVRSVDTTNVIAGNLAFKQSATNSGDVGYEAAAAWLAANSGALNNDALASGYASSFLPALGVNQTWDNYWNAVLAANNQVVTMPADPATGNTVAYAIQRLCSQGNIAPTAIGAGCATSQTNVAVGSSSKTAGTVALTAISQTVYRITARIQGPRNTLSYVQVIVAL
jgi:type IV pilus assembly protein PilX